MSKRKEGKIEQNRIMTAVVGSYPKPKYLFQGSGRRLLDSVGMSFYDLEKRIGPERFNKRLDRACLTAIRDQSRAGIDFISDGEERRDHYIMNVLRGLEGIDFENLKAKSMRAGRYLRKLPVVVEKIGYKGPILVEDFLFTLKYAWGIPKISLPGPITVIDTLVSEYYRNNREKMARDYAEAIRNEVESLITAGCRAIQFDDPVLLREPQQAKEWGLEALQACFRGYEQQATFFVHICRGYPDKASEKMGLAYKASQERYGDMLEWLSESSLDVVSIEGAQGQLDLSILPAIGKKKIMLGVINVGSNRVEQVLELVERGKEALQYLGPEQLILSPDCGMLQLSRKSAQKKLANLAKAAAILNERIR